MLPKPYDIDIEYICNHYAAIELWSDCFTDSKFCIRRYEKEQLIHGDIVSDFCNSFIPNYDESSYEKLGRVNETLSLTGMSVLRKMNIHFPFFVEGKTNNFRGDIASYIAKYTNDGSSFLPTFEQFELYQKHFADSIEAVRQNFFPGNKVLFTGQKEFAESELDLDNTYVNPDIYSKIIADLWSQKRATEIRISSMPSFSWSR